MWRGSLFIFMLVLGTITPTLNGQNQPIKMVFQETVCPPQWISYTQPDSTLYRLKQMVENDSIHISSLKFTGKPFEITCAGCGCGTGRFIEVLITTNGKAALESLGFKRPWIFMEKIETECDWTAALTMEEIEDSLIEKGIRYYAVFTTGASTGAGINCNVQTGRIITIQLDADDKQMMEKKGFVWLKDFKQY